MQAVDGLTGPQTIMMLPHRMWSVAGLRVVLPGRRDAVQSQLAMSSAVWRRPSRGFHRPVGTFSSRTIASTLRPAFVVQHDRRRPWLGQPSELAPHVNGVGGLGAWRPVVAAALVACPGPPTRDKIGDLGSLRQPASQVTPI